MLTPVDIADAFDDFNRLWQSLTPREQAELLQLLVAKVEFDQSDCTLAVSFHSAGLKSLENHESEEAA